MMDIAQLTAEISRTTATLRSNADDEKSYTSLLKEAKALVNALEQPSDIVTRIAIDDPSQFLCLRLAVDLQLFDLLKQRSPQDVSELATACGADPQLVLRITRALAAAGVVVEYKDSCYGATPASDHMTTSPVRAGIKHWYDQGLPAIASAPEYFNTNGYLSPPSSTDGPLQYAFKTHLDSYQYWQTQPAVAENFNTFMTSHFGGQRVSEWSEFYPQADGIINRFDGSKSDIVFVDVGGGCGRVVNALRKEFPDVEGRFVLQDLPEVIDEAGSVLPLDDRVELVRHDFFQPQPLQGACVYFMANILHNWPDRESLLILKNLADAMTSGYSRLLICDMVLPDTDCSEHGTGLDIGMMYLHSGMQRSEGQWFHLLTKAGLRLIKVWRPSSSDYSSIIEAAKD